MPPMDPPAGQLEREASFKSAGDRLSRESSFASVGEAFGTTPSREGYASPDRQNLEGFTYQPDFLPPEITASPDPPEEKPAPADSPRGLERFFSARPAFDMLFRRGSLDSTMRSQDLSGFIKAEGLEPPEDGTSPPAGGLVGSVSSPDFRRTVSGGSPRRYSGPLPGLDPLAVEDEDYTFVRKWGAHEGVSPSVRSSSIGGRSSSREVMMWMGEAGMLDEEDEVIIHDETKQEPPKEEPRPAFGWWPFGRRRSQEDSKPSSPNTSQELGPHSEPSAESVAGPPTQPLASESSAGSLPGRLALEESLSPEIGLAKAGGGATRLGGVQKTTGAAFAAKAVGEALSFEGGAETGSYFSLGINDSGKSENARAAEELTPGVDETARRAAATAGYFSLGINDSADDAGASVGAKVKARLATPRLQSPAPGFQSAAARASSSSQEDVKMMVSPRPPSIPRDLTSTSLDQSTVPTELSRSVRQDVRSVSTRLGPVNTAFFASQGMQPPGVSRELRFGDSASAGQDRVPPAASTPPGLVSATQTFPASGKGIESPTSGQPVLARGPERSPPSELDVDEGAAPRDPSSSLASVGEESEAETSAQPGALTPSLPAMEAEGQIGSADGTGGVKSAAGNRRDLSASLGPVNTAFFRSQGMEPPGSSGSVAEGADLEPAKASSVNTPPAVKGAAAGSTLEGVHTEWGTGAPGGMAASELPVKVGAEGAGQERTRVFSEGIPREARPEESPEALNVKGEAKGGASKGRSEGVASEVGASDASKPVSADLRDVSAGGETENEVPVALSSVVVKDAKVGLGESASRVGKGAGVEAVQMSTGASESEKPGAGDSGARSLESSRLGPLVATPAISEGKDSGAGKSTTDFLGGSGPVTAAVVSEGTKLGAGDPTEARPQPELEKSEPDIARESGVTEGAEDVKSQPAPYAPTNPSQTPEQAAPASLSAVSGRGAEPTGREAIIEAEKPVKVKVSLSRPPEVTAVGPTALPTMAAAGAVAAGVGVAATAGQSRGDEASEAGSGTSKKSKSSQWKRFKSLFGRKGAKGEPTPSGEERPAPGRDAQQVSKAAIGGQAELPQLERDESDEISWAGSVKEEEPPPGWTESGEGFEGSSSQRASSLGPTTVGEEAEVQSAKQERALARPDQGAAETSGVTSVTHERALELPVEGRTAGVESVRSGAEGFERTPLKAVEGLGVMVESEVEPVKGGVSEQEHESEKPIAKGGDLVMPAAEQSGLAPGEDKEGPTLTEGLSALEKEAAETETARARVSPVEAADGAMRESGNGASERGVTGNVTAQEAQGVATVLSEGEEGLTLAPTSQPSARGPLVTAREGVPRGAAESAGLLGTASLHPPVSATSIPEAASVDSVGANPKVLEDPPSEPTLNTVKGVPVLRGSVSARIRALEQLAAPKVVEGVELGAPKERGLQNLISLQDKSGGQPASGGVDTGAVQSAEVPSKSAESREEPLSGTVPARGSLISGDVENEGIKSAAVAKEGERLTGSGLAEEFAAGKGAVWGELEDDDEVTMESPGRGVMALESVVAMPGDLSQFETAREAGMAESGALMPRNLFPAKTLQDGGKDMGAAASIPEDVSGTMVQDEAGAVAPVPGGLTQALEAKIAPATAISAFGEKGFGQEGAKSTGGRAAPEPGLGLTAAPGRVLESGAGAIEPKQPGYLGGDVIATEIGRKPQDSSLTQRSDSPTEEVNSKPQRPLPQLERSPSPEIPSRWGPRSREPSPVAKRVDVPFASFGGVSNAPQASPRGDAASFGGMPSTLRGAQYSDSGTPTPIPGSFGGVSRAFHEPPLGELRGFSTPTPASTPTTTLVEQSGFPPGAVKAMAKQSPRESAGVPIPGFATPQMRAGAPEPSSFDAGFAKLRINLEAYQSPPDVFNSPRTSKRPPSPAAALPDAAAEKSSVGERPSEQPTEVPAVQAEADPPVSGVEAASEAERSQLEPGLETQSVEEKVEKEVAGRMNKERDVVKTAPAVEATPPPAPPQISTAPVVVPPTPPAATLDPAPPSKAQLHGATDAPLTAKASPQVAPHLPQATQPEVKTPGPAGASPSVPGVPSPTTTAGPVAPAKPAREDQSITPAGSPAPAVLAPEQPVVPQAAVSEPGARVPTTQKGLGTTAGTAQDLSLGLGGVVSGFEGQLTKVPATSDDLGDLIKIAEAHLGEARRKLAAASFNGREAENNQVAEDGTLAASQHAPQTPLSEDASKTPRALSAAAAVASAGAATLVATQAAKDGALATKGLSFGDGNGSTLEGTRSGIVGKPSEMEGKALAAEWLAAQGSPVSVPRQQLTERGNDPLARVAVPETLEAVGGLELEKGVPSLGVGSSGVSSGSAIGGANLAPVSGAQADAKPVAQQPVLLSAAMEAEIERARGELEKIKAALAVAEGKKQKGLKERVSASKGAERKPELPGDGKGTSELHAGARELPTLVAGIEEPLEGHPGGKENAELVGEATNEGSAAIGAEAGGASENEIADLDARVESADPGDGKRGTPEKEGSAAGLTQEEGLPIEALAGTKSGFDAGAPETGTVKEVPAAQALKASSADGATVESGNDDLVGTVSPGTRRQNESEVEKAAPRRRVSFSDVETLHEIERMTAESGGGSATRLTASAPVGAGLGAGLRTGLAGPLAPIPEVNRTYSLSTGFGELQPHSRRRGISVESDAEQTRRETPTVLADPWESEAAQYEPKGRVEERGNASGKAGAVATGMGAGAAALLVARPMTGGFTEGAARVYAGLARTKSAEGMGTGLAEAQSKETVSVGSLGDENIKGSSLGPGEKAAVGEAVPEKEGASRSVAVESIGVPDAKESSAVGRRGPEPGVQGSGSTAGAEEVSSSPKRRSVAPSGWAAILGWPRSDEAKPAAPPVSTPLAATSGRGAEAAAKPEGLSRGIEMGRKGDALKVDAEMSVSGGMGESGPTKRTLAGVSSATTMVEPEELSREGSLDEKVGKSEVGTVEVGKKAQVAEVGSAEGAETVHVPKTGESFDNGLAVFGGEREKAEEDAQRRGESVEGGASAAAEVREIEAEAPSVAGPEEGPRRREGSAVGEGSEPPAIVMMGPVPAEGVVELGAAPEGQVMERGIDATVVDLRRGEESAVQRKVATREEGATDGIVPGGSTRKAVVEKASSGEEEEAAGSEGVPMPRRREGLALGPSFSLGRLAALSETRANLGAAGSPAVSSGIVANNVPQSITGGGSETGPGTTPQGSAGDAAVESGNARPVGVAAMPPVIPTETGDSIERIPVETVVGFLADGSIGKREERESPERRDVADIAFGGEANAPASGSPTEALRAKDDPGKPRQVLPTESTPPVVGASEGPVPQESVIPPSETETTGTEAGPSEAPEKQAYAPLTGGSVSVSPLVTSVAASAGAAEALRPAADVPAGVLATDDGAPNRAFTSSTPNSGLGKDLPTSGRVENESPKPRHVKKKLKASEGVTAGLLANPAGITELNPFSASKSAAEETSETKAFVRRAAGPKVPPSTEAASETSAQGVLIQEEALTQLSAPLSTSSVSQTTALKPTPNPLDSPSATSKTVEAPVDAASPANEIEEIAAVAPTTPPLHSKARRHRPKVEPLGGAKEDGARSAKSSGRSPAAVDDSPVRGLTRRPGAASPGRQSPRTPRLKIVSPSASPGRTKTPSELPRTPPTPSTIGRRTRLTNLSSPSFKPRAAQIAPLESRGEKEDTSIKNVLSSWEEEESNFLRTQMAGSRLIRERKAAAAEQAAIAAAGLPPRPRSSSRAPPTEGPGESLSPELLTRPFTTPPVSELEGRRRLEAQLRFAGSELRDSSGGVAEGWSTKKSVGGRSDGQVSEKRSMSLEEWKEKSKEGEFAGPRFGSVSLPKGSKPAPVAEEQIEAVNGGLQTGFGSGATPASQTGSGLARETKGLEQGLSIGLASNERAPSESKSGRALPTSAVPEPQESLWEDQGATPGARVGPRAETLPKETPRADSKPEKPARTHKKRQFLKDLFRRKKKDKSPPASEPALVFRPIPASLAPPTPAPLQTQTQSHTPTSTLTPAITRMRTRTAIPASNQTQSGNPTQSRTQTQTPRLPPLILLSSPNPATISGAEIEDGTIERRGRGLDLLGPTIEIPAPAVGEPPFPADVSTKESAPLDTAEMTRSAIGDEAKDPSSSRDGFLGEEKPKGYDVSKMLPTPGRDGSPTPVASFAAGTFSPRQISARKPPLSPASRRVAKPAGGVETGAAKPSSLSPAKEERANDPAWKLDLPSGLPTAAERAEYESGGAPAGTSELEDAKQSEEPVKVADAPSMGALTAGAAAAGVLAAGAAVAGGLTAGAAAVGVLTPGAAAAGVLTAGAAAAAGAMTAGALETKAESGEGAALEHSGLEPVGADEAAERTGGTAVQAESGPAVESGDVMAAPTPIPSAIPLPRLEDYGGGDESPAKVTPRSVLPTNDYGQGSPTGGQKLGGNATDEAEVGRARQSPGKSRLDGVASLVLPVASTVEAVGKSVAAGQKDEERIISPQIEEKVAETLGDSVDEPNRESVAKHSLIGVRSRLGESGSAAAATMESDVSQAPSDVNPAAAEQDKPTTGGAGTQVISEAAPAVVGGLNPGSAGRPGELQGKAGKRKKGTAAGDPSAPRSPKPVSKWLRGVFFWGSKSPGTRTPLPDTEPPREVTSTGQGGAAGDFSDGQSRFGGFPASTPIERQKTGLSSVSGDADRNLEAASPPVGPSLGSFARPPTSIESAQKGSATEPAEDNRGSEDNRGFEDKRGSPSESRSPATGSKLLGVESAPQPFPPTSEPAVGFTMFENPLTTTQTSVEITSPDRSRSTIDSGDVSSSGDSVPLFRWPVGKLATPPSRGPKGSVENAFDDDSASGGSLSGFTGGGGKGAPQNALEDDSTATSGGPRVAALAGGENWRLQAPGSPNSARTIKALRGSLPPLDLGAGAQEDVPSPKPQARAEFPLRYAPSEDVLIPPSPGKGSPRGATSAGSGAPPLSPLSASKSRNLGSVPEEDIVAALEREKSKHGSFLEPLWGRKEGVTKSKSKSRSRKKGGDVTWGSAKGSLGDEAKLQAPEMVGHGVDDYGDRKGGELGQEVAAHPKKGLGKERSPLGKPSATRRRGYDWKQHVEVALRNDDTWRLTGEEKDTMSGVQTLETGRPAPPDVTPDSSTEFVKFPGQGAVLSSPRKAAVTRTFPTETEARSPQKEKKAKLGMETQGEESAGQSESDSASRRKPAIPFLYEQAMLAAYEPLVSGPVVKKDPGQEAEPVDSESVKWPAMDLDDEPPLVGPGAGVKNVV